MSDFRKISAFTSFRAVFVYQDAKNIVVGAKGEDGFAGALAHFHEDSRAYAFIRVQTGDDLSSRAKFVLITWVGEKVSPLQKARVSTDKAVLKGVVRDFSVEVFANTLAECDEETVMKSVNKAMGANYGSSSS